MNVLAKVLMGISLAYYAVIFGGIWIGQMTGLHNDIWEVFDFPPQDSSPPLWSLVAGLAVTVAALFALGLAYQAVWRILDGGKMQDFRSLAAHLKRLALGLIGFWFCYNVLSGVVQFLITVGLESTEGFEYGWDPLDLDIIFLITAIAVLAISQTLERAWLAEEETRHFL